MNRGKVISKFVLVCLVLSAISGSEVVNPPLTIIRVDARRVRHNIPRSIFGTFLEPIGNSIYNGLWAELLQNPSFEANLWEARQIVEMIHDEPGLARASKMGLPLPWEPLDYAEGSRYSPEWNDAPNSYRSLLLMALPEKQTGVRQKVYLPIHRVHRFTGSLYLKFLSGLPEVEVSIRRRNSIETIAAKQTLALSGSGWKRYDFTLEVGEHSFTPLEPADFVIAAAHETRVLIDQASLLPADTLEGMDPEMVALARALKTPSVRFGGNFTSAYHWRDGVGPSDKRVSMLNTAWGMPEYNQFGTDEFLAFCRLVGAEPQIALNLGTGTPQEAAEWVRYVNARWGDHGGGLLWELGNELWGDFQVGYPTLARVADRTKTVSTAVRDADRRAQLIATGGDPDHFAEWNAAQLANASDGFRYLSTHFVVTTSSVVAREPSPDFIAQATFALPLGVERQLKKMHEQFEQAPGGRVRTAFTEWLFWAPNDTFPRYDNMGGAVATGGFLNMLVRNADIVPIADMTGIMEFGGIWKKRGRVFAVPAYWAFHMYANASATRVIETSSSGETYDVAEGSTRIPTIEQVPYLDVVAALNDSGDKLTLFSVNRDLSRDRAARIEITGFEPGSSATVHSLYGDSLYETNDENSPEHIHPHNRSLSIENQRVLHTFRHASVSVIEFRKK